MDAPDQPANPLYGKWDIAREGATAQSRSTCSEHCSVSGWDGFHQDRFRARTADRHPGAFPTVT